MPNAFCNYLSNGYTFDINSTSKKVKVMPCCHWRGERLELTADIKSTRALAFESVTDWTDSCKNCHVLEKAGHQSLRQTGPMWINTTAISDPVSIDINLDHECNAACAPCSEWSSSLWYKEKRKFDKSLVKLHVDKTSVDRAIDKIVSTVCLDQVRYIKFFGGEPLFTDTHLKFLIHVPNPEQVTLHYTTNGSIYPNAETLAMWKKFKTVIFAASLDGIQQQFDYVRWPLSWNKVSDNLLRIKNNPDIWNVLFRVEFTANFLNAYYFDRLETWIKDNLATNGYGDTTEITMHNCWGGTWDIDKMPLAIRELVLKKYPVTHPMHTMVANLAPPTSLDNWKIFTETWDPRRKNNWKTAFPDLIEFL